MSTHPSRPSPLLPSRRTFLGSIAAGAAVLGAFEDEALAGPPGLVARPPAGFVPASTPGRIVKVTKSSTLQQNGLWPEASAAKAMLERVMSELTGLSDMGEAFGKFVHKDDKVAIKPNGIAGRKGATMASNKELVLAVVRGVLAAGVPPANIMIFEQYPSFLAGTRVADTNAVLDPAFPAGIRASVHNNENASMAEILVGGVPTKFVTAFTEATAVINIGLIKDHSICGYTGCMKNITYGAQIAPHLFHEHTA